MDEVSADGPRPVAEAARFPVPGEEPMGLAFDGATLWIACRESHRLFAFDPATAAVAEELAAPGAPFGLTFFRDSLYVVIGHGHDDDDRFLYRYTRSRGFADDPVACPDLSGVHLAADGDALYLSQAHNRKIVRLDARGAVVEETRLERVPVGLTVVDGAFYLVTGDRQFENLQFGRLDAGERDERRVVPMASFPFGARDLAFDGTSFWTADRAANAIVRLRTPALE